MLTQITCLVRISQHKVTGLGTTKHCIYLLCYAVTKSCIGHISREWVVRILKRRGPDGLI